MVWDINDLLGWPSGFAHFINEYIVDYCHPRARKSSNKLSIKHIVDLPL
jgi:hypothetical protein